jgi:hypothetical protein
MNTHNICGIIAPAAELCGNVMDDTAIDKHR